MNERYSRQSFLGSDSEELIADAIVGIVGLGGGGSHIVQQLAHIGVRNYVLFDSDVIERSNLNRLVIANLRDSTASYSKLSAAKRKIRGLHRHPRISGAPSRWQQAPDDLAHSDIVFGCLDGLQERNELETFCRRHLIPYIDIGMDVFAKDGEPPRMAGQVILSIPGGPCMKCLGFLNDRNLAQEAANYGAAGPRPQVVWPNGVLASTAVGLAIDVLTGWTKRTREVAYLIYDGNTSLILEHPVLVTMRGSVCPHYPLSAAGKPKFTAL